MWAAGGISGLWGEECGDKRGGLGGRKRKILWGLESQGKESGFILKVLGSHRKLYSGGVTRSDLVERYLGFSGRRGQRSQI